MRAELEAELMGLTAMINRWAEQIQRDEADIRHNGELEERQTLSGRLRYTTINLCLVDEISALTQLLLTATARQNELSKRLAGYDMDDERTVD
jgi:hypothetical protein